ncbi:hypothetical protein K3495_g1725 [Podosphaera aphanis]|nr:hypothetical protein K3495_g1725 [Podosphaera aphanis]
MALSTTSTAILNEARRWEIDAKNHEFGLNNSHGQNKENFCNPLDKDLSFIDRDQFTNKENSQNQETAKNGLVHTNQEDILAEKAWELIIKAVSDHDLDDVKKAAEMYVKVRPEATYQDLEQAFRDQDIGIYLIAMEKELAETFTNMDMQGKIDKTYSITWRWSPRPLRPREIPIWPGTREENMKRLADAGEPTSRGISKCTNCDALGHTRKACPEEEIEKERVTVMCFNCQEPGHRIRDCPQPRNDRFACKNCNQSGHSARECPEPRSTEGIECNKCKELGHFSRDCPQETVLTCRNCDEAGHIAKECPLPRDYSRVKCQNCEKYGHTKVRCKEPIVEVADANLNDSQEKDDYLKTDVPPDVGGWENQATTDVPSDIGGWDSPANAAGGESWEKPVRSSENTSW